MNHELHQPVKAVAHDIRSRRRETDRKTSRRTIAITFTMAVRADGLHLLDHSWSERSYYDLDARPLALFALVHRACFAALAVNQVKIRVTI